MSSKNLLSMALTAAAAFLSFVVHADDTQAVKGVWTKSSWNKGFVPAENNVIFGRVPDEASSGLSTNEGSKNYNALTDGFAKGNVKDMTTCLANNAILTYSLGEQPRTITEVRIYSTWSDAGRDTLNVSSVVAKTAGGDEIVLSPSFVSHSGDNCCACVTLKMQDDSPICTDAVEIIFNFGAQENGYVGYAELEVLAKGFVAEKTSIYEITAGNDVEITATPSTPVFYGLNGGNLVISGNDTVVEHSIAQQPIMNNTYFGDYWPWIEGTVTVKDGATLISNTQLFRGSGVEDNNNNTKLRQLIVESGAKVAFQPERGYVDIIGIRNGSAENAAVRVTGEGSVLTLPDKVYVGKKNDGNTSGHKAKVEIKNGGLLEAGRLYLGWNCSGFEFLVDGATVKALKGISVFDGNARWTASTISFKDCLVKTPFYKCAHASSESAGDKISFDGAVFRPVGEVNAKYFDTTPVAGAKRIVHTLSGNGLIIEAPEGSSLEVSGMFNGDGGFTKRGAGMVVLSANNEYMGTTKVESGKLEITGSLSGALAVSAGAEAVFSSVPVLPAMSIAEGGRVSVAGYGAEIGDVANYAGSFEITGVDAWPRNTALVKSNTAGFLEKIASELNNTVKVEEGYVFSVVEDSVQLVRQGITNGTIVWTGAGGDTSWSTEGNWSGQDRRLYSGDTLVVGNGGTSTVDFGEYIVLKSVLFNENIGSHTIVGASDNDTLSISSYIHNKSPVKQTFSLPVSIGSGSFEVFADGDLEFSKGIVGDGENMLVKKGAGTLLLKDPMLSGSLDLREGAVVVETGTPGTVLFSDGAGSVRINGRLDAGGAIVRLSEDANGVLGENAILENGRYEYVPRKDYNYLALAESQVLTITNNAVFYTTAGIFENGTGSARGVRALDGSTLEFDNNSNGFISSKDNGASGFLYVSGNSVLKLPRGRTYIAWPSWAGRNGRIDVLDGSFVSGGSVEFGWRASTSYFTLTNSAASFSDGLYLDVAGNIDWAHSHMFVSGSSVTSAVWRVGNSGGNVNGSSELWFDDATLVPSKADTPQAPYFLCTKPDCNQIKIQDGGLKIDAMYDVTFNAPLGGTGGLTKLGEGILELASINTYAGATVVAEGTLRLTGRVAGAIQVASGAALEFPIPAEGAEVPEVSQLAMAEGSALRAVVPALPEGVERVDVLRSSGEISVPTGARDASGYVFYVASTASGNVLRYGRKPGFSVILR